MLPNSLAWVAKINGWGTPMSDALGRRRQLGSDGRLYAEPLPATHADRSFVRAKLEAQGALAEPEFLAPSINSFYCVPTGRQTCYGDHVWALLQHLKRALPGHPGQIMMTSRCESCLCCGPVATQRQKSATLKVRPKQLLQSHAPG